MKTGRPKQSLDLPEDTTNGRVIAACKRKHRHQEYLNTLEQVDSRVPQQLDIVTQRAIRRGTFTSVKELIAKVEQFVN